MAIAKGKNWATGLVMIANPHRNPAAADAPELDQVVRQILGAVIHPQGQPPTLGEELCSEQQDEAEQEDKQGVGKDDSAVDDQIWPNGSEQTRNNTSGTANHGSNSGNDDARTSVQ